MHTIELFWVQFRFFTYQTLPKYQYRTAYYVWSWYYRKLYGYLNLPCLAYICFINMHKNMLAYDWTVLGTVWFFPHTKPYLNTNTRRHIMCGFGTIGSSMATWTSHAWLTSVLSKCKKHLAYDCFVP